MKRRDEKTDKHPSGGRRGAGTRPSHQWGSPGARLRGGRCGVHVAEELFNLPQGDTPTAVAHLGEVRHARGSSDLFSTHSPALIPLVFSWVSVTLPGSSQAHLPEGGMLSPLLSGPQSQGSHTLMDRSSSPKATMTLIGGRTRLDSWLSTVARMAFCGGKGAGGE